MKAVRCSKCNVAPESLTASILRVIRCPLCGKSECSTDSKSTAVKYWNEANTPVPAEKESR